jgi:dihydroorotate dehydrogenase (NAD+) catalytic subunit
MDFTVKIGSLVLKNPILTASGTFGYGLEFESFGDLKKLGGIIVKGLSLLPRKGNPGQRIAETPCGMLNAIGLENIGIEAFLKEKLPYLPWKETPIIVNLYGEDFSEFERLATILSEREEIAALEVNISCPNVKKGGMQFGQDVRSAAKVCEVVKKAAGTKTVIMKLSPNVSNIREIAKAVENAGADSISLINTIPAMAVDIYTRRPKLTNIIGGLSGPAIKPIALRMVYEVVQTVDIPVIGIGGICNVEDVFEFILVGAYAVEIGSASFTNPMQVFEIVSELEQMARKLGIKDFNEYRGSLLTN